MTEMNLSQISTYAQMNRDNKEYVEGNEAGVVLAKKKKKAFCIFIFTK